MEFRLDEAIELLERTPLVLRTLLAGLSEPWLRADEGPETWAPFDVVGHLIDGDETDWIPRARIILGPGLDRTFEPFDRSRHLTVNRGKTLSDLLQRFEQQRASSLGVLRSFQLTEADLVRTGRHPALGEVTLAQLLATWVAHDLGHLAQIARVMAKRYADDVGPWRDYLPVLAPRPRPSG